MSGETLVMHLGMSGSFRIEGDEPIGEFHHPRGKAAAHDHVVFGFEGGARVVYNDPRRFGYMDLIAETERSKRHALFAGIGIEPLGPEFTPRARRRAGGRAHAAEGRAARPAPHRRARQHLRLRGAAPREALAAARGGRR